VSSILWTGYQEKHITQRHGITATEFEEAWLNREDSFEGHHPRHGPYFESMGFTQSGRLLEMVWRWQDRDVWPITAYGVDDQEESHGHSKRRS